MKQLKAPEQPAGETLADRIAQGPLPLGYALRCATDIAIALRDLHQDGRAHGRVEASTVLLRRSGARLVPSSGRSTHISIRTDVAAFGWVLHQMLTGHKPHGNYATLTERSVSRRGAAGVHAAALRLAERCYASPVETAPTMQKVLTEVRLLAVIARQPDEEEGITGLEDDNEEASAAGERAAPEPHDSGESSLQMPRPSRHRGRPAVIKGELCPRCGGNRIRKSKPRTTWEQILTLFGITIRRCHRCYYRYIMILQAPINKGTTTVHE